MKPKTLWRLLLLAVALVITFLATACSVSGSQFPPDLMEAYNQLPDWAPMDLNPCPGTLNNGQTIQIVGYRKILDASGYPKDPYLNFEYIDGSGSRSMSWYTEFANPVEISNCISQKFAEYGYSFWGLWSTWLKTPPTPKPTDQLAGLSSTQSFASDAPQSNTASNSNVTSGASTEIVFYWVKPDGTSVEFGTKEQADDAMKDSWEGGHIWQTIKIDGKQTGDLIDIGSLPTFTAPNGPDGNQITLPTTTTPYYINLNTGAAFTTLAEALANAKLQLTSTEIHSFTRGVDMGTAQYIPECVPPFGLGPTDNYYGVDMLPASNVQFFTVDQKSVAETALLDRTEGGTLDIYTRCEKTGVEKTVLPFTPPSSLASLPGYKLTTPYYEATSANLSNLENLYFLEESGAISAAENFRSGRVYPGGTVTKKVRGEIQGETFRVGEWNLPQNLPTDFNATSNYVDRLGTAYLTKEEAISSNPFTWYFGVKKEKIVAIRRGIESTQIRPYTNWWAGWQWLIVACILFAVLYKLLRNEITRMATFGMAKAAWNLLWVATLILSWMYVPNALHSFTTYALTVLMILAYLLWYAIVARLHSMKLKETLREKVLRNQY